MAILTCLAAKPARDAASEPFHGGPLSGAERQLKHEIARFRFCPNAVIQVGAKECLSWGEKAEVGRHGTSYPIL
jgi:hypothetical protein